MSDIEAYAEAHTTPFEPFMDALARATHETQQSPQMLTGPLAGRVLNALVWVSGARRVLEIGTYTGYSALAMAEALPEDGEVITCELDPERAAFARSHIDATPYAERIRVEVGPALATLRRLDGPFDLVFIDADKTGYPGYVEATLPLLAERGAIVLDNTLQGGRVLQAGASENADVMRELNARLAADDRLVATLLPVRDGMTIVRRRT